MDSTGYSLLQRKVDSRVGFPLFMDLHRLTPDLSFSSGNKCIVLIGVMNQLFKGFPKQTSLNLNKPPLIPKKGQKAGRNEKPPTELNR